MSDIAKLFLVASLSLAISYASDVLSEPPISPLSAQYRKDYQRLSEKELSREEFQEFRQRGNEYLGDISASKNLQGDLEYIIERKLMIVPIALCLWFLCGFFLVRDKSGLLVVYVIVIALLSLAFINIVEALSYGALFAVGNIFHVSKRAAGKWR